MGKRSVVLTIYTSLFFIYIFIPLILIFIFAWNSGEGYVFPLQGFTWDWFAEFFSDSPARRSIGNSAVIALSSATISTILASILTLGLLKGGLKRPQLLITLLMLPVLMPSLTIGISALVFFRTLNLPLGIPLVIIAHVSVSMSYVFLIIMGRIESLPLSLQEASVDLGASWISSIKDVVFPILLPGVIAGWLFAFMVSWNEFIITYFLIGSNTTLPIYIFSQLRFGISPKVNVISVLVTIFTLVIIFMLVLVRKIYKKIVLDQNSI
ncbi:MAG: ABC transporter permease [Actinobacteria bacterium]|nr:ABC transporter permease [Actinomycetota bacterium]